MPGTPESVGRRGTPRPSGDVRGSSTATTAAGPTAQNAVARAEMSASVGSRTALTVKTAVMMPEEEFTSQLRGWVKGSEAWPEMDGYARGLGVPLETDMIKQPVTTGLAVWLFGKALGEWLRIQ